MEMARLKDINGPSRVRHLRELLPAANRPPLILAHHQLWRRLAFLHAGAFATSLLCFPINIPSVKPLPAATAVREEAALVFIYKCSGFFFFSCCFLFMFACCFFVFFSAPLRGSYSEIVVKYVYIYISTSFFSLGSSSQLL